MTIGFSVRMGVRTPPGTGISPGISPQKEESPSSGSISPQNHATSEASNQRPKFMITDILSHQHSIPNSLAQSRLCQSVVAPSSTEPKDLSVVRHLTEEDDDDDIDLDGDASNDDEDNDLTSNSRFTVIKII